MRRRTTTRTRRSEPRGCASPHAGLFGRPDAMITVRGLVPHHARCSSEAVRWPNESHTPGPTDPLNLAKPSCCPPRLVYTMRRHTYSPRGFLHGTPPCARTYEPRKKENPPMKNLLLMSCLVAALAGSAQGATIAYEGVQYPPSPLNINGPAFGFSSMWSADPGVVVVGPVGLSHPLALPSTGNRVAGFFNYIDPLTAPIAASPGKVFWASFLLFHSGPNDQAFMGLSPAGVALGDLPTVAFGVRL